MKDDKTLLGHTDPEIEAAALALKMMSLKVQTKWDKQNQKSGLTDVKRRKLRAKRKKRKK